MQFFQDAKLKAGVWLRERKERAAERKAAEADPPGVTVPAWLVRSAHFAGWIAYAALMYFLWERVLDVSEAQHSTLEVTHFGIWSNLNLSLFFPLVVGYVFVVIGVPYVAKIAIPILVSLSWRDNFWPKLTALVITILVSLVLITGTATVGSNAIIESERSAAVAVQGVEQEAAVLASRIADKRAELDDMVNNASIYVRTAASMSPAAYDVFIEERRGDWQYDRLRSYRATSVDAQRLRDEITALRDQQARQTTTAAVSSEVVTARTQTLNSVMDYLNTFWVLMLAVVMDLACLFMPWIAMRLEQTRNAQLGRMTGVEGSGWAAEDRRIEDLREEEAIVPQPMKPAREVVTDAETGEELIRITPKPHWRKAKGKKQKHDIQPDIPPDETGAPYDGGGRTGSVAEEVLPVSQGRVEGDPENEEQQRAVEPNRPALEGSPEHEERKQEDAGYGGQGEQSVTQQTEPSEDLPELQDDDLLTLESEEVVERQHDEDEHDSAPEAESEADTTDTTMEHYEPREPETDPRKLIAAE